MWTPIKSSLHEKIRDSRSCFTEQRGKSSANLSEQVDPFLNPEKTMVKDHKMASQEATNCTQTNMKKKKDFGYSEIFFRSTTKTYKFPVFNDNDLGFNSISQTIIPTKADEDCRTVSDIAEFGRQVCLRDLQQAVEANAKTDHKVQKSFQKGTSTCSSTQTTI